MTNLPGLSTIDLAYIGIGLGSNSESVDCDAVPDSEGGDLEVRQSAELAAVKRSSFNEERARSSVQCRSPQGGSKDLTSEAAS